MSFYTNSMRLLYYSATYITFLSTQMKALLESEFAIVIEIVIGLGEATRRKPIEQQSTHLL
jgi:hypothetical protein